MLKLTKNAKKYIKFLRDIQVQLVIPATVKENFTVGYLVSNDGLSLAQLEWIADNKQLVMISLAPKEDTTGNNFIFFGMAYTVGRFNLLNQPYSGNNWYATTNEIIAFSNTKGYIDPNFNIYVNSDTLIINNCTVTNSTFDHYVSFDMSLTYVGPVDSGKNLLLLAADSMSTDSKD